MYLAYASAPEHFVAMLGLLSLTYIAVIVYVGKKAVEAEGKNYSIFSLPFLLVCWSTKCSAAATSLVSCRLIRLLSMKPKDVGPKYF